MEKVKRYYWIKLKTDFFNLAEIDFLLSQENGCKYIVLYQMLCLQTANNNGELTSKLGEMIIPYNVDKIATDTKHFDTDTVIVAMELFKKLNLIYAEDGECLKIAGFKTMVGSETKYTEQKRSQRNKQKLLSGQCPENVLQEIDKESELDIKLDNKLEGQTDGLNYIYSKLKEIKLLQEQTQEYDEILKSKKVYLSNIEYMPAYITESYKLYQLAIKRLYDNKQAELLERANLGVLEKVFGKIIKSKRIDDIEEYYISSLLNEITK